MGLKGKVEKAIDKLIENNDPKPILGVFARAQIAMNKDEYCKCKNPEFGVDAVICEVCGLYNQGQMADKERRAKLPHKFRPIGLTGAAKELCHLCAKREDNPIHQEGDNQ